MTAEIKFERTGLQRLRITATVDMHVSGLNEILLRSFYKDDPPRTHIGGNGHADENQSMLTVEQVADILQVGRDKVYQLLRTGQLRSIKIGNSRRISQSWVTEFIERTEACSHSVKK